MATADECDRALRKVAARLAGVDSDLRDQHAIDRTWTCHVPDIAVDFSGRIEGGAISMLSQPDPAAQIKLTVASDDLVALTRGELNVAAALASGRLRVDANVFDLLRLRSLF